jgi:carboxymethylenebutenolidase
MASRTEPIRARDGGEFPGHVALPESGSGPGMVVIQEIFGVNDYIKGACERLANLGYVALAPDLYWRLGPGIAIDEKGPGGLDTAYGLVGRLDFAKASDDAITALEHLGGLPEVTGGNAGIVGFCLGGGVADDRIPIEKQQAVKEAFANHPGTEFHVHEGAGHAFDNHNAATMHHERAAREAWAQTADFLKRTLPV